MRRGWPFRYGVDARPYISPFHVENPDSVCLHVIAERSHVRRTPSPDVRPWSRSADPFAPDSTNAPNGIARIWHLGRCTDVRISELSRTWAMSDAWALRPTCPHSPS